MKTIPPLEQAQILRRLEGELNSAQSGADSARRAVIDAQKREASNLARVKTLQAEIAAMSQQRTEPVVSEHALLRWIERVEGVDLEALRKHILAGGAAASINFAVTGSVFKEGHELVFKDRVIVTVK